MTVLDALMFKRGMAVRSLSQLYQKAQLQLMKFEHVDMQYIPRWVADTWLGGVCRVWRGRWVGGGGAGEFVRPSAVHSSIP